MRVVADTGPLHYLVLIGEIDLLPRLFETVLIPEAVQNELLRSKAPTIVRHWAARPPTWLAVSPTPTDDDPALQALDDGERSAIVLSQSLRPDLILMDDRAGVTAARAKGFVIMGTIGFLDHAAQRGLVDLTVAFAALRGTNFHVRQELLDFLLTQDRERHAR
jgi:predicted nucleic acid-binding protein